MLIYTLNIFQYWDFGTLNPDAFKLLVKIYLAEIFETVNQFLLPAVIDGWKDWKQQFHFRKLNGGTKS